MSSNDYRRILFYCLYGLALLAAVLAAWAGWMTIVHAQASPFYAQASAAIFVLSAIVALGLVGVAGAVKRDWL